jgi:hypothetical protein
MLTSTAARADDPPPKSHGNRNLGMLLAITGGVLDGGAVLFGLEGRSRSNDAQKQTTWDATAQAFETQGLRDNKLAYGFAAVGTAALVTGLVLIIHGDRAESTHVALSPTSGGAQLSWSTRF